MEQNVETEPLDILVVDDSPENRELIQIYLKKTNYNVVMAEHGEEAVSAVKKKDFDVIFMDIQMPIMDGYQASVLIREWEKTNNKKASVLVALTANSQKEDQDKCFEVGCDHCLTKPIRKKTILEFISDFAQQGEV